MAALVNPEVCITSHLLTGLFTLINKDTTSRVFREISLSRIHGSSCKLSSFTSSLPSSCGISLYISPQDPAAAYSSHFLHRKRNSEMNESIHKWCNPSRKYLPQLAKYPESFIYEPWKAPLGVQRAAGCIIGQDYPRPIVDHSVAMKRNLERMGKAYRAGESESSSEYSMAVLFSTCVVEWLISPLFCLLLSVFFILNPVLCLVWET